MAEVSVPKGATASDIICHLNFTYGTKFDVREFDVIPQEDGDLPELYKVKAKADNLAYTGEFDVFVDLERMPLAARLLVTDLDGFGYPNSDIPSPNNPIQTTATRQAGSTFYNSFIKDYGDLKLSIELDMGGNVRPQTPYQVLDRADGVRQMAWRYSNQGSSTAAVTVTASKDGVALKNSQILEDYDVSIIEIGAAGVGPEMKLSLADQVGTSAPFKSDSGLLYPLRTTITPAATFRVSMAVGLGAQPAAGSYPHVARTQAGVNYISATGGGSTSWYRGGAMIFRLKLKHRRNPNKPDFFIDFPVNFYV